MTCKEDREVQMSFQELRHERRRSARTSQHVTITSGLLRHGFGAGGGGHPTRPDTHRRLEVEAPGGLSLVRQGQSASTLTSASA